MIASDIIKYVNKLDDKGKLAVALALKDAGYYVLAESEIQSDSFQAAMAKAFSERKGSSNG